MKRFLIAIALLLVPIAATAGDQDAVLVIQERRPQSWDQWTEVTGADLLAINDDDIQRHVNHPTYFTDIQIDEWYVRENGFVWHLLRFTNVAKAVGPLWLVPHDDENAAFDAMMGGIKRYGGVGIAVNSGPSSVRKQSGKGTCGGRPAVLLACDPNRNFSDATPLFTNAILGQHKARQPVIALHTNTPGYGGDKGQITMLDPTAANLGQRKPRSDGYFGNASETVLDDPDVYAILPYAAARGISEAAVACRRSLNKAGVNVWHEKVSLSDGSLSNYITLHRPEVAYVNMEAKREVDLSKATKAQTLMIEAYLAHCSASTVSG